jgi:hypothetical protein
LNDSKHLRDNLVKGIFKKKQILRRRKNRITQLKKKIYKQSSEKLILGKMNDSLSRSSFFHGIEKDGDNLSSK